MWLVHKGHVFGSTLTNAGVFKKQIRIVGKHENFK